MITSTVYISSTVPLPVELVNHSGAGLAGLTGPTLLYVATLAVVFMVIVILVLGFWLARYLAGPFPYLGVRDE